jgi:hypothetical protein
MAPPRRARQKSSGSSSGGRRPDGRRLAIVIVAIVVVVVLVLALVIAAFGGGSSSGPPKTVGTFNPQIQFEIRCLTCHRNGPGPHLSGPTLVKTFPTVEDQVNFVAHGKGGMPAFKDLLTQDELRQIVEYTRTLP